MTNNNNNNNKTIISDNIVKSCVNLNLKKKIKIFYILFNYTCET